MSVLIEEEEEEETIGNDPRRTLTGSVYDDENPCKKKRFGVIFSNEGNSLFFFC